ncbi:MAG: M50 family metallopeptidase [Pseudonocardiaceae bacterium]
MDFPDTERNRAAVHEAGHALIAALRGLGVAVIELHSSDGEGGMRLREEPSKLDRVWVLYGGPFAEKVVFRKLAPDPVPPERDELLLAHSLCWQLGIYHTLEIRDQVEAYLREQQAQLELITARLLETNTVHGVELDELLREALPSYAETVLPSSEDRDQRSWSSTSCAQPLKNASEPTSAGSKRRNVIAGFAEFGRRIWLGVGIR